MKVLEQLQKEVRNKISNDPAHDFDHIIRVYKNAEKLSKKEKANTKLILSAALLHDIVNYRKSDKRSKNSSTKSAIMARKILSKYNFSNSEIKVITDAIRDHSFLKNKTPSTLVGKILQDADRLDAIGAIGIARAFAVSGSDDRPFYNGIDPFCSKNLQSFGFTSLNFRSVNNNVQLIDMKNITNPIPTPSAINIPVILFSNKSKNGVRTISLIVIMI